MFNFRAIAIGFIRKFRMSEIYNTLFCSMKTFRLRTKSNFYLKIFTLLILTASISSGQVSILPHEFSPSSDITISFDASMGNGELKDFRGEVYMHTGIIQGSVISPSGWTYVQGNWGQADEKVKMNKVSPNKYEISFNVSEYYGIPQTEDILQIALVFRDAEGKLVAKTGEGNDIYFPDLEILEHGKIEKLINVQGQKFGQVQSIMKSEDGRQILIKGDSQALTIVLKSRGILNIRYYPSGDTTERFSYADILDSTEHLEYKDTLGSILVKLDEEHILKISKSNLVLELNKNEKNIFSTIEGPCFLREFEGTGPFSFLKLLLRNEEHIYGLGSRAMPIDRAGNRLYVYNKPSYNYQYGEDDVYLSLPYFLSSNGYGFLLDSYRKSVFDIGHADPSVLEIGSKEDHLSFYILYGDDPEEISFLYNTLTGFQELPPLWSLGYFQSRYGYKSQNEIIAIIDRTIDEGFPIDATVLDLYWFGGTKRMGDFNWDLDSFPDPDGLIGDFDKKGIKTILTTESYVVESTDYFAELDSLGYFATDDEGNSFIINSFWCGPAALIDVFIPDVSEWLWKIYKREYDRGIVAWWCDSGEPENHPLEMNHYSGKAEEIHNIYALQWTKIFYDNFRRDYPNKRLFNLTRSGYPGMQRYNSIPWSGDASRTWSALRAQPSIMMGTGLCGVPYIHSNIGGFTGTDKDDELFIRWIQLGTFSPVMRVHGDGHMMAPEPIFRSKQAKKIAKKYIKLRYELLPYNYTLAKEVSETGKPFVRPMFYHYQNNQILDTINGQYLWGRDILVAPVLEKGKRKKRIYLAKDDWYNYHTNKFYKKNKWINIEATGTFLPTLPGIISNTRDYDGYHLFIKYYYDRSNSSSKLFIDDGVVHQDSENYDFELWNFSKEESNKWITLTFENENPPVKTFEKFWEIELNGIKTKGNYIKLNGKKMKKFKDYYRDVDSNKWIIKVISKDQKFKIQIRK